MTEQNTRPTTVWDTGRTSVRHQLKNRYIGATRSDGALTPAIARRVIATYTAAGGTVCDPQPGAGIVLSETVRAGRHAVGIQPQRRWQSVCEANLDLTRLAGPTATATLLDDLADPRAAELPGAIDLVLTGLRHSPKTDPVRAVVRLYDALNGVADWVWPGGHIVVTCRPWRRHGRLLDLLGQITDAADAAGLVQVDHCIALTAPVRSNQVRPRVVTRSARTTEDTDQDGRPLARAAHIDVLVFRVPHTSADAIAASVEARRAAA